MLNKKIYLISVCFFISCCTPHNPRKNQMCHSITEILQKKINGKPVMVSNIANPNNKNCSSVQPLKF